MMKNLLYTTIIALVITGCSSSDDTTAAPTDVTNISAEPRVGGALVKWEIPADGDYTYLQISYLKNGKEVIEKASKYTDTLVVNGLVNKEEFSFDIQAVNETPSNFKPGSLLSSNNVRPIKRSPDVTYYPEQLEKLTVTDEMIDTFTQEASEGPKKNLVDGNPATYWHSAWSGATAPLPHWIQVNFEESTEMGAIMYWFRNPGGTNGRPKQWGLETSDDGITWTRVWTSKDNLPITNVTGPNTLAFDKNYTSKHFRAVILKNESMAFAHLGEISFHKMDSRIVDKEEEAEGIYYNF